MICNETYDKKLCDYLSSYGIDATVEQRTLLLTHLDLLVEKNKVVNLTRIVDPEDAIVRHVVDSLLLLPTIDAMLSKETGRFVDVGTGGGFPGIPLGVMRPLQGTLIDSVGKKVAVVNEFIESLGLIERLHAQAIRAEDLAHDNREGYDLVVARAVAELGVLVEYAQPLLMMGGYLVVSKANISAEELELGDKTARMIGLKRVSRETYELPHDTGHREIISYKKVAASKIRLPRKAGMAKHKPLAS